MWFVRTQKALYLTLLYKFALRMLLRPRMLDLIKYNIYIGLTSLSESPFQSHQYYPRHIDQNSCLGHGSL